MPRPRLIPLQLMLVKPEPGKLHAVRMVSGAVLTLDTETLPTTKRKPKPRRCHTYPFKPKGMW